MARGLRSSLTTRILVAAILAVQPLIASGLGVAPTRQQAATSSPADDVERLRAIGKLVDLGSLVEARTLLSEEISLHGETYQTLFLEAKILFREQKYRESMKVLERSLALNQRDVEVYKLVASNAILLNRTDIAEQALTRAQQLAPQDALVLFNLGALYYTDSRFPLARPVLEKSVSLNPDYVPPRLFLGLTLEELGDESGALDCYLRAIALAERSGFKGEQPYLYPGRLLYRENRFAESLPYLEKAAKSNPQSCETLCLLARIYTAQGREADAVSTLTQCVQADSKYPDAHYLLSRAFVKQGRKDEAAKELAQFEELRKIEQNRRDPRKNQRANR